MVACFEPRRVCGEIRAFMAAEVNDTTGMQLSELPGYLRRIQTPFYVEDKSSAMHALGQ